MVAEAAPGALAAGAPLEGLLSVRIDGATIHAVGRLLSTATDLLVGTAAWLSSRGERVIWPDLSGVTAIDSAAVTQLVWGQRDLAAAGTRVRLVGSTHLSRSVAVSAEGRIGQ
jgi:anti-anti-sigma regulatory factor